MFKGCNKQNESVFTSFQKQRLHESVDKASSGPINNVYVEYKHCDLQSWT